MDTLGQLALQASLVDVAEGILRWTLFDLPTRGTESRYISILERPGQPMQVVLPYSRGRKVGVLTPRTEAEITALKTQVGR